MRKVYLGIAGAAAIAALAWGAYIGTTQWREAASIAALGTFDYEMGGSETKRYWYETQLRGCVLTISSYDDATLDAGKRALHHRDEMPLDRVVWGKQTRKADDPLSQILLTPKEAGILPPEHTLVMLAYRMGEGAVLKRLMPLANDPEPPFVAGPDIDGQPYVIADRDKGMMIFYGLHDLDSPERLARKIAAYATRFCGVPAL